MSAATRLPDFIVIGAAKSGTTTLYRYLCEHPRVFMCTPKEPCFFDREAAAGKTLDWYQGLFAQAQPGQLLGEASTNYTRFPQVPGVPELIREALPQVKLIFMMRDPVQRTYSHYVHRWSKEVHPGEPFTEPFREYIERDRMCIDGSDYALQLDQYARCFGRDRLLLLTFESFHRDRAGALRRLGEFLGLDGLEAYAALDLHAGDSSAFLANAWRTRALERVYATAPWLRRAKNLLPAGFRRALWRGMPRLPLLRDSFADHQPQPMSAQDREYLERYFAPRNLDLAARYGVDIGLWSAPARAPAAAVTAQAAGSGAHE